MAKAAKKKTADLFDEVADDAPKKGRGYTAKDWWESSTQLSILR